MLAKMTSKNQITIPKKTMDQIPEMGLFPCRFLLKLPRRDDVEVLDPARALKFLNL